MTDYLIVFAALFALDFVWAIYTKAISDDRELWASVTAVAIILLSGTAIMKYAHDATMLIPAAFGAFAGTWASIKAKKKGWLP